MNTASLTNPRIDAEPFGEAARPSGGRPAREADQASAPMAAAAANDEGAAPVQSTKARPPARRRNDLMLILAVIALTWTAWQVSHMGLFKPSDDISYWIAVVGGSMMLLLLSYPLRKHVGFMRGLGKVKWWFWFHLLMGVGGPWLILVHSGFNSESLNAGVALYSMVIVVASGVIGLFIYVRVHRGLDGERTSLQELSKRAGFVESEARSRLHFAPAVEQRLLAFEQQQMRRGFVAHLSKVTLLPLQQKFTYVRCIMALRGPLNARAAKHNWTDSELKRRRRRANRLVDRYLNAVVRVAQYTAFERLFALWHVAHLPFVYLLILSAIVHVIAVHAY
jgi:uncharacterized membrane protein YdcZ (DUF606 family)